VRRRSCRAPACTTSGTGTHRTSCKAACHRRQWLGSWVTRTAGRSCVGCTGGGCRRTRSVLRTSNWSGFEPHQQRPLRHDVAPSNHPSRQLLRPPPTSAEDRRAFDAEELRQVVLVEDLRQHDERAARAGRFWCSDVSEFLRVHAVGLVRRTSPAITRLASSCAHDSPRAREGSRKRVSPFVTARA
jgi:hypothetical protein